MTKDIRNQFVYELPKLVVGILIILFPLDAISKVIFIIVGLMFIALAGLLVYLIIKSVPFNPIEEEIFFGRAINSQQDNDEDIIDASFEERDIDEEK